MEALGTCRAMARRVGPASEFLGLVLGMARGGELNRGGLPLSTPWTSPVLGSPLWPLCPSLHVPGSPGTCCLCIGWDVRTTISHFPLPAAPHHGSQLQPYGSGEIPASAQLCGPQGPCLCSPQCWEVTSPNPRLPDCRTSSFSIALNSIQISSLYTHQQ